MLRSRLRRVGRQLRASTLTTAWHAPHSARIEPLALLGRPLPFLPSAGWITETPASDTPSGSLVEPSAQARLRWVQAFSLMLLLVLRALPCVSLLRACRRLTQVASAKRRTPRGLSSCAALLPRPVAPASCRQAQRLRPQVQEAAAACVATAQPSVLTRRPQLRQSARQRHRPRKSAAMATRTAVRLLPSIVVGSSCAGLDWSSACS